MDKRRVLVMALLITTLVVSVPYMAHASDEATGNEVNEVLIFANNHQVLFEGDGAIIYHGYAFSPVLELFEALGFVVERPDPRSIILSREGYLVVLNVGVYNIVLNGVHHELDISPQIINGRAMVPVRAVLESIEYYVGWDSYLSAVMVLSPEFRAMSGVRRDSTQFELHVFELTNIERTSRGLPALLPHESLSLAAREHSRDMWENGFMSHIGSDDSSPRERVDRISLEGVWNGLAENVASGHQTPEAVVLGWMDSPGHRANILNPYLTYLGVGRVGSRTTQKFMSTWN
ncbi:MAG: CAP domain-containing protein [Defluviitaleaceae bacterium]|nr:CAP domain-containing protein [Defluviitaleaceae bacterium]